MYINFSIHNFRGFDNLTLNNLGHVNLISGMNNIGKTALLEAIMLHSGAYDPKLVLRTYPHQDIRQSSIAVSRRGASNWNLIFRGFDTSQKITLEGQYDQTNLHQPSLFPDLFNNKKWGVQIETIDDQREIAENPAIFRLLRQFNRDLSGSIQNIKVLALRNDLIKDSYYMVQHEGRVYTDISRVYQPLFPSIFLASRENVSVNRDAKRFSELNRNRKVNLLLDALQVIEPRLRNLELFYDNAPIIYGDIGLQEPIPLTAMGDGINRVSSLVLAISSAPDGVVLIDEIENGLHYSVYKDVWKAISRAARDFNVQIFATTHSLECIRAAHLAFTESDMYDFRYHLLEQTKSGNVQVITRDQGAMEGAITLDLEVR